MTCSNDSLELLLTLSVESLDLVKDHEWVLRITTEVCDCILECVATERRAVSLAVALVRRTVSLEGTLTHHTLTDDEGWLSLHFLSLVESLADLLAVVTVDCDDMPSPCTVLHLCVLCHYVSALCRELDVI